MNDPAKTGGCSTGEKISQLINHPTYVIMTIEKGNRHKVVDLNKDGKPPYPLKDKGGFLLPKALLTYQVHERQQCHDKNTELHEIIEIKLVFHLGITSILCRVEVRATLYTVTH